MSTLKAAVLLVLAFPALCVAIVLVVTGITGPRGRLPANPFPTEVERGGSKGYAELTKPSDYVNRIQVQFSDSQRFGLICPRLRDPQNTDEPKRLTRDPRGVTNNPCLRVDGYEYLFGHTIPGVRFV